MDSGRADEVVIAAGPIADEAAWHRLCPHPQRARVVDIPEDDSASFARSTRVIVGMLGTATTVVVPTALPLAGTAFEVSAPVDWDHCVLAPLRRHAVWSAATARAVVEREEQAGTQLRPLILVNMHVVDPDDRPEPWSTLVREGLDQLTRLLAGDERLAGLSPHAVVVDRSTVDVGSAVLREVLLACQRPEAPLRDQTIEVRGGTAAIRRRPSVRATATVLSPPWSHSMLHRAFAHLVAAEAPP